MLALALVLGALQQPAAAPLPPKRDRNPPEAAATGAAA